MDSGADGKGLRHNRRHKKSNTAAEFARVPKGSNERKPKVGDLVLYTHYAWEMAPQEVTGEVPTVSVHPELHYLHKWGAELTDPHVRDIEKRLSRILPQLSAEERDLYFRTAESIAEAERAKSASNRKVTRDRYRNINRSFLAATKLVHEIGAMFPPPWEGERALIGDLVQGLVSFVGGTIKATFPDERNKAIRTARLLIEETKRNVSRKARGMHWELIRDLAWLASQKKAMLDERTVRRYLEQGWYRKNPAEVCFDRNGLLILKACESLGPGPGRWAAFAFEQAVKRYLNASGAKA